jgi:hypothetical protein
MTEQVQQVPESVQTELPQVTEITDESIGKSVVNDNEDGGGNSTPEDGHENDFTPVEQKEIEGFIAKLNLPKGVSYLMDKGGELKFVVPINGKRYLVTPQDVFKGFNLQQAGYQMLNEGKQLRTEVQELITSIKRDPQVLFNLAEELGHDPYELAAALLRAKVEEAELTPEQRQQKERETDYERIKRENEELRLREQNREFQQLVAAEKQKFDIELTEAMVKHGFKKFDTKTKSHILAEAVKNMKFARENGRELSADDAVYLAKQTWQEYAQGVFDDIDDNHIVNLIPDRIIKAIRKADLSRLRNDDTPTSNSTAGFESGQQIKDLQELASEKTKKQKQKSVSIADYFESL